MRENEIGTKVIEAAITVHRELGPGLLETVYEVILARELSDLGLTLRRQVSVPIIYKGIRFDEGFLADIIVENMVLLELKSVERILPARKKQVQTNILVVVGAWPTVSVTQASRLWAGKVERASRLFSRRRRAPFPSSVSENSCSANP